MVLRYFGIHMDHIENIIDTLKYAKKIGANCLQIYLGDKTLTTLRLKINLTPKQKKEIRQFLKACIGHDLYPLFVVALNVNPSRLPP